MIARVLTAALVAGFLAACVATTLQFFLTTPLILQAEKYEKSASAEPGSAWLQYVHAHEASPQAGAEDEWKPAEGLSRVAFTGLATLVSSIGYALVLIALILGTGHEIS